MTATTTADILAAMQLIEEHGLSIYPQRSLADAMIEGWWCTAYDGAESWPIADSPIAAVKAWAEAAGVPWPSVKVVPMWCSVGDVIPPIVATANRYAIEGYVVPCDVVIREPEGV